MLPRASEVGRPVLSMGAVRGLHLTADLQGCCASLNAQHDKQALAALCRNAVENSGLRAVAELFHPFQPDGAGITGVILLAESHLAVHTWPEVASVTLDVYVCNITDDNSAKARKLMDALVQAFEPKQVVRHQLERGSLAPRA